MSSKKCDFSDFFLNFFRFFDEVRYGTEIASSFLFPFLKSTRCARGILRGAQPPFPSPVFIAFPSLPLSTFGGESVRKSYTRRREMPLFVTPSDNFCHPARGKPPAVTLFVTPDDTICHCVILTHCVILIHIIKPYLFATIYQFTLYHYSLSISCYI